MFYVLGHLTLLEDFRRRTSYNYRGQLSLHGDFGLLEDNCPGPVKRPRYTFVSYYLISTDSIQDNIINFDVNSLIHTYEKIDDSNIVTAQILWILIMHFFREMNSTRFTKKHFFVVEAIK